jgi:CheY-like chemotaxis protein
MSIASILLVDDEELNRLLLGRHLTREGYDVSVAGGGREALDMLSSQAFDLILLDLRMPGMDGLATLDAIRCQARFDGVPILMLTASNARESVVHCLSLGAADYIIKPVDPADLAERVLRQLQLVSLR